MGYHILCIDDDAEFLLGLKIQLKKNYQVSTAQTLQEGFEALNKESIDLILLDVGLGKEDGIEGLKTVKECYPHVDVVMVSGQKDPKLIVEAIRQGASDYLCKPCDTNELDAVIEKMQNLKRMRDRHDALVADMNVQNQGAPLIGQSRVFVDLLKRVRCVKGHEANVLLLGESGTGKELIARYIHDLEDNPKRPFIAVNCAAIPDTLIESELFGHERGAFTGASNRKIGKFELANGGDIFLDEINSLKLELQAKILRVIQEHEIYRLGGTKPVNIRFRVIAASNVDLESLVEKGEFRVDLFHRLRVLAFKIPSLRDRVGDIPLFVDAFLTRFAKGKNRKEMSSDVLDRFMKYPWPGNVRELENLVHSLVIMTPSQRIELPDLPAWLRPRIDPQLVLAQAFKEVKPDNGVVSLRKFAQMAEAAYILRVMKMKNGDKSSSARLLGISRSSLYDKIRSLH